VVDVSVLRQFNRSHTQRIGALEDSFLATGRPLGPSRLLFEIGPGDVRLLDLRRRLGLDSGYLSRLLRSLEVEGLLTVGADPTDARQRLVRLTAAGTRERERLDQRSEDLAQRLLAPLSLRQRAELDAALTVADRLLRAATVAFDTVDPRSVDARRAVTDYFAELDARFPSGFDPGDALDTDAVAFDAPDGAFVVARDGVEVVGCGGLQRVDATTAEIKRMWIDGGWRGLGLGQRLLAHLELLAREQGRTRVVLDTNGSLLEAIAMYERAGYHAIERYNDNPYAQHWFAKDL
jgi:DNA-binding MarR family transcriptional regulator